MTHLMFTDISVVNEQIQFKIGMCFIIYMKSMFCIWLNNRILKLMHQWIHIVIFYIKKYTNIWCTNSMSTKEIIYRCKTWSRFSSWISKIGTPSIVYKSRFWFLATFFWLFLLLKMPPYVELCLPYMSIFMC